MSSDNKGIAEFLEQQGLLNSSGDILDDAKFVDLLFAVFVSHIVKSRVKRFWSVDFLEQKFMRDKLKRIHPLFHLPFHFIGLDGKTVFVSDKSPKDKLFNEQFIPKLINSFQDIEFFRRISSMSGCDLSDEGIQGNHACTRGDKPYCPECSPNFEKLLIAEKEKFFKAIGVSSSIVLNIPLDMLSRFISEDDLIEEIEDLICQKCGMLLSEFYKHCPECSQKTNISKIKGSNEREKMFNNLFSIYLKAKTKADEANANISIFNDSHEADIEVLKKGKRFIVEVTTQVDLKKDYIIRKGLLYLLIEKCNPMDKIRLILWSLDKNCSSDTNKSYLSGLTDDDEDIYLLPSSMEKGTLKNPTISIPQNDLDCLKKDFCNSVIEIVNKAEEFLDV